MRDAEKGLHRIPSSPDAEVQSVAGDLSDMTDDELWQWEAFFP